MTDKPQRFRVIDGKAKPRAYRASKRGEPELLVCHVCEQDLGVATALTIGATQGRMVRGGKPEGGTKGVYCVHCLMRGKTTKLI